MLLCIIFGVIFIACTIVIIILKAKGSCNDEPAFANYILSLCSSMGILSTIGGVKLSIDANKNYTYMMIEKSYIEENIDSDDIFTSLDASNRYFQYQFKLEQMKRNKENGWIASMYYFYDLDKLELNIQQ